jgi:acetyl esterase/lipase
MEGTMWRSAVSIIAGVMLFMPTADAQFARQEFVTIQTMTISDNDFLDGKTDGTPVTIAGRLLLPKATPDAKQPAVILIHGSGGVGGSAQSVSEWERELTLAGYAVFTLDSFTGRGIVSTVADQSQLGRYNAIVDAYRALEIVAQHRNIDGSKIAVMGFSRGGQASTYANLERFWKSYGSADRQSQLTLAFMPAAAGLSKTTTR